MIVLAPQELLRAAVRGAHLNAGVCVAQLWVICNDISPSIVTTCELQAKRLGQVHLWGAGVCQRVAVPVGNGDTWLADKQRRCQL